ncbi:MAG: hypothetical protein KDA44_11320 [Planctomycetales bacterium]|nr:hypothetical protein [Planctomycetales bacterium]
MSFPDSPDVQGAHVRSAEPKSAGPAAHRMLRGLGGLANAAPVTFSLAVVFALQLFVVAAFRPSYATNDDVFMTMVASGRGVSPAPDAHLVFTNVLIGGTLKGLYTLAPNVPWYGGYLLTVHLLAQTALLYCALSIGRPAIAADQKRGFAARLTPTSPGDVSLRLGVFLICYTLVEIPLINRLQFTSTAFLAGAAGVLLLLAAMRRRTMQTEAPILGLLSVAVSLIVLGGLVRFESFGLAMVIAAPVALFAATRSSRNAIISTGLAGACAVALVAGAVAVDRWYYEHDPQWSGFRSLNQLRGKFHDDAWTEYTAETAPLFAEVGWTENDHAMIARWYSEDDATYAPEKLQTIIAGRPWQWERQSVGRYVATFREIARNRAVLSVFLALPLVLIIAPAGTFGRRAVVATATFAIGLLVLITWAKKEPPIRVFFPVMSFPMFVAMLSLGWRSEAAATGAARNAWNLASGLWSIKAWRQQTNWRRLALGLTAVALAMGVYSQARRTAHVTTDRALLAKFLDQVPPDGQTLYVSWEAALPYELVSPLDNLAAWPQASFLSLAWTQKAGWHEEVKRRFAVSDVAQALFSREDVQLIAGPEHRKLFERYVREHYGVDVDFVPLLEAGQKFTVGRYRKRASAVQVASPAHTEPPR